MCRCFLINFVFVIICQLQAQTINFDPQARLKVAERIVREQSKDYEVFSPFIVEQQQAGTISQTYLGAVVRLKGKYGFLSADKQMRLSCEYEAIYPLSYNHKTPILVLQKAQKYSLFNPNTGKIHPEKYDSLPKINANCGFVELSQNGQKGGFYLSELQADFANILPCQHEAWKNIWLPYQKNSGRYIQIAAKTSKGWQFLDSKFQPIDEQIYEDVPTPPYEEYNLGYYRVAQKGFYGLVNKQGQTILPCAYAQIDQLFDFGFMVQKNGKWGLVDTLNKPLAPFEYEAMRFFLKPSGGDYSLYVCAQKGKKWGVLSYERFKQNTVADSLFRYDSLFIQPTYLSQKNSNGQMAYQHLVRIYATKAGKAGILNPEGEELYPFVGTLNHKQPAFEGDPDTLQILQDGKRVIYDLNSNSFLQDHLPNDFRSYMETAYLSTNHSPNTSPFPDFWLKNMFIMQQGKKWGIFNFGTGQWEVASEYDTIHTISYLYPNFYLGTKNGQQMLLGQDKNQKLGVLTEGFQSIEPIFMNQDIWKAKKAGKYGFIRLRTQQTTDFVYDTIHLPIFPSKFCVVKKQGKIGIMDEMLQTRIPSSLGLDSIPDLFWAWHNNQLVSRQNSKWGVVDTLGNILLPFEYEDAPKPMHAGYWIVQKSRKYSILDTKTKHLRLKNMDYLEFVYAQNPVLICRKKSKYTLLDTSFQQFGEEYAQVQAANFPLNMLNSGYLIAQKNQKYGVLNHKGAWLIEPIYDSLTAAGTGYFIAQNAGKVGVLDTNNQQIINIEQFAIYKLTADFVIAERNGKLQAFPLTKEPLKPFSVKSLYFVWQDFHFQDKNGKWGWLNPQTLDILAPQYDSLVQKSYLNLEQSGDKIYLAACQNGKWGLIDEANRIILPFDYEEIMDVQASKNALSVKKNGKTGLINLDGQALSEFRELKAGWGLWYDYTFQGFCYSSKEGLPNLYGGSCWTKNSFYPYAWIMDGE